MSEIQVFDPDRLLDIATCHHPIQLLPKTLTGLGRVFLGVAQLRAQNKIFALEAEQLTNDRQYKIALIQAGKERELANISVRKNEIALKYQRAQEKDIITALKLKSQNAMHELRHRERLQLIEDSFQLALFIMQKHELASRQAVRGHRQALSVAASATRGVKEALSAATAYATTTGHSTLQTQFGFQTVIALSSDLTHMGTAATTTLNSMLDAASRSSEMAFQHIKELAP